MLLLFDGDQGAINTLRFVEEKIGVGLWSLDIETDRMEWSSGFYALLGLDPGSVEPSLSLFRSMMHPEDRLSRQDIDRIMQEGIPIERDFRIIRRDGRIRWVANRGEAVVNVGGRPACVVGLIYDVSAKQGAIVELRALEQRYRTLTRAVSTIVWTAPPDGQMSDFPEWREMTGQTLADYRENGWLSCVHPEDRDAVVAARTHSIALQLPYSATYRVRQKDGSYRWFNSRAAPVRGSNGQVKEWVGILIDVFQEAAASAGAKWLTGAQARAARAILNWTVKDVAEAANISVSTVRRLEENDGQSSLRDDVLNAIKTALENGGVEFIFLPTGEPAVRPNKPAHQKEQFLRALESRVDSR